MKTTESLKDDLAELLVTEGVLGSDQLDQAKKIRARMEDPLPLASVLVRLGYVSRQQVDELQQRQRRALSVEEILVNEGVLTQQEYDAAREAAKKGSRLIRDILIERETVTERQYLRALCTKHELPFVDLDVGMVDPGMLKGISMKYLREHKVVPLMRDGDRVACALADPLDETLIADLQRTFGRKISVSAAPTGQIESTLDLLSTADRGKVTITTIETSDLPDEKIDTGEIKDNVTQIVDMLIARAVRYRASDIHLEPMAAKLRVRFRVDGALIQVTDLPKAYAPRITSRIKIMSGADISERRRHQDGRIMVRCDGKELDLRASFYVTVHGENTVLRILDRAKNLVGLDELGFAQPMLRRYIDDVLESASGILLITGPTGSGKTTTLYSSLDYINDPQKKVISCEDPVEYVIPGIVQCSINEKVGPTFADTLRAIVRQDPDTIVLGEIRDHLSAETAIQSALTGHRVYSTLHTEDAVSAMLRLVEMDLEPYLVASTLSAILAQRLVRRICPECRDDIRPDTRILRLLGVSREDVDGYAFAEGRGCDNCHGTGYRGRLGIYELLIISEPIRDALVAHAPTHELRRLARATEGYVSLQEDGIGKAVRGETTFEEILDKAPRTSPPRRIPEILDAISDNHHAVRG